MRAKGADPDQALSGPSLQRDGLSSISSLTCLLKNRGSPHYLMVIEAVWLAEAMWLQLLIGIHVLAHTQWGLHPLGVKHREGKESAELPDVLVKSW